MASALESSTGGVAGRQPSVAQQHIGIDLSSCAGSRRRRWSRASSGAAAPVEGVVGRGGAGRGRRRAWWRRSRASSGAAAPVEGVVGHGGVGRGRRRARRHRSRASSGAAAPVEGVVRRGGAGRGRRRAWWRRSRASSGAAAPVEGVVGCGGAGRGRRPPLRGAPLRGAPRTTSARSYTTGPPPPCWRPRQATAACRAAAVAAQPACAARLANRPRVCSTSWSGLRATGKTTWVL